MSVYVGQSAFDRFGRLAVFEEGYDLKYDADSKVMDISFNGITIVRKRWRDIHVTPIPDYRMDRLREMWSKTEGT